MAERECATVRKFLVLRDVCLEVDAKFKVRATKFSRQRQKLSSTRDGSPRCTIKLDLVGALVQVHCAYLAIWADGETNDRLALKILRSPSLFRNQRNPRSFDHW